MHKHRGIYQLVSAQPNNQEFAGGFFFLSFGKGEREGHISPPHP